MRPADQSVEPVPASVAAESEKLTYSRCDYPTLGSAAADASARGKRSYYRLIHADLLLLLLAALTGTLAPYVDWLSEGAVRSASAALLVLGLGAKAINRIRRFDQEWFDGRAVAESVKTTGWRFIMRVPPFARDDDSAEDELLTDLREMLAARSALSLTFGERPEEARPISPRMREIRALPLESRREIYVRERVNGQIRWYAVNATRNGTRAIVWFWLGLAAQSAAVGLTILSVVNPDAPNFAALMATAAATATAWTQLGRHDELNRAYGMAAQELMLLKPMVEKARNEKALATAVVDVESAVSREHTMWMAKKA